MRILFALLLMVSSASASTMTGTVQNDLAIGDTGPVWISGPFGLEIEVLPPPYFPNERADGLVLGPVDPPADPVAAPLPPAWSMLLAGLGLLAGLLLAAAYYGEYQGGYHDIGGPA